MASRKITSFFVSKQAESTEVTTGESAVEPAGETPPEPADKRPKKAVPSTSDAPSQRVRNFPVSWLATYKWLRFDEDDNSMFCECCRTFGHEGSWSSGTRNFRLKTVQQHLQSELHKTAAAADSPGQTLLGPQMKQQLEKRRKAVEVALKCAYWISLEEIANRKYGSLITFLQELGLEEAKYLDKGKNASYKSPDIFNQLISCLSKVQEEQIKAEIKLSPFVGLGTDESTDRSLEKHLVVIVRYIATDGKVITQFLKLTKLAEGTAQATFHAMEEVINTFNISWKKVVGLGADGASVMSGERNGLRGLIEDLNPFCTYVHCVCHRLHLAVSQACHDIPEMESVGKMIGGVYNFMSQSTKRLQQFKDIAAILDSDVLKFKKVFDIRWLSMGESIQAVVKNYEPLVVFLSQEASAGEPVAIGLHNQLTSYTYLALLHLAADVLSATNHLNRLFQHRDICFAALQGTIFDPASYPDEAALVGWGNQKLRTLLNHYGQQKTNKAGVLFDHPIDPDIARGEFLTFKRLVFRHRGEGQGDNFHYYRPTELFQKLFDSTDSQGNRVIFPEMFKLMCICMCVMVGNAEAERVFSCQNRIKSKLRTLLSIDSLDRLVRLSYSRTESDNFPFSDAADIFFASNRRI